MSGQLRAVQALGAAVRFTAGMNRVLNDVVGERFRQIAKWGDDSSNDHPDGTGVPVWDVVLRDAAQRQTDEAADRGEVTWRLILNEKVREAFAETAADKLRAELIQVAAVAVKWVEALDRREAQA